MRYTYSLLLGIMLLPVTGLGQIELRVTGNPVFPLSTFDLTEAGTDYSHTITSTSGPMISISHKHGRTRNFGEFAWNVAVHKSDIFWNNELKVDIRRSSDGEPASRFNNRISGGTNFQTLTDMPLQFFEGGAARDNIDVEFRINNISVLIPADEYETTVYFTVYSN
jgi:hypothetical protein